MLRSWFDRGFPGRGTVKPWSCHGQFSIKSRRKGEVDWVLSYPSIAIILWVDLDFLGRNGPIARIVQSFYRYRVGATAI